MKKLLNLAVVLMVFLTAAGFLMLRLNLEQMTDLASDILAGECTQVRLETDRDGREIQVVTFRVDEVLKGRAGGTYTFRQLRSWDFSSLPQYSRGESGVLFLDRPHPESGLTAPIGLTQGKFVVRESEGRKVLVNGIDNRGLLTRMRVPGRFKAMQTAHRKGPLPYDQLVDLVRERVR